MSQNEPVYIKLLSLNSMNTTKEYILCAAIWYKELQSPHYNVKNINSGIVLCGHRHPYIIYQMLALKGLRTVTFGENAVGKHIQGFLTSNNRFVGRLAATRIAYKAGQVSFTLLNKPKPKELYSEDIY